SLIFPHTFICTTDHLLVHKRACAIMDEDIPVLIRFLKPVPHGSVTLTSSRNDLSHLCESVFVHNIFSAVIFLSCSSDEDDLVDQFRFLECFYRIVQYRLSSHQQILLMYFRSHTSAASCCEHDRCTVFFFHMLLPPYLSPSFRLGTAFRSQPCRVPARNS